MQSNSQTFGTMDPADLQFRQLRVEEVVIINGAVDAYAERYELSVAEAKQELTQQALLIQTRALKTVSKFTCP